MTAPDDAIPAATLVLVRDRIGGPPDLLMVERAGNMAFAAGAVVFPGGRVDPGDYRIADNPALSVPHQLDPNDAAARVAAIRETIEECGVAVGFSADHAWLASVRARMASGQEFSALLAKNGWRIDLEALVPFARWRPSFRETRIFDTRFYIARAPSDAPEATVDATENVRLFWASASDVLTAADRGEARIIFPTRRNLERLACLSNFAETVADARTHSTELVIPWIEEREGRPFLCIPEDRGYPITAEPLQSAIRG